MWTRTCRREAPLAGTTLRAYDSPALPVFIERHGPAYHAEVARFIDCVTREEPFDVTLEDGPGGALRAHAPQTALEPLQAALPLLDEPHDPGEESGRVDLRLGADLVDAPTGPPAIVAVGGHRVLRR